MLLRHSLRRAGCGRAIERAVGAAIGSGARTRDIAGPGARDWLGTKAFTDVVLKICARRRPPRRSLCQLHHLIRTRSSY